MLRLSARHVGSVNCMHILIKTVKNIKDGQLSTPTANLTSRDQHPQWSQRELTECLRDLSRSMVFGIQSSMEMEICETQ